MKLTDEEVLEIIKKFNDLDDWWGWSEGARWKVGPVEIVEKNDDAGYDSWSGYSTGPRSMVFEFGEEFFRVEAESNSYDGTDWYAATIKKVTPKTRSVSYYE